MTSRSYPIILTTALSIICWTGDLRAAEIDTILRQQGINDLFITRAPLFRTQIYLTYKLSQMNEGVRRQIVDKFHSEYGTIQSYQQMEAKLARTVANNAVISLNTEADRLGSGLPTVAPAPTEFLARQAMRLATEAIDLQLAAQLSKAVPDTNFEALRANVTKVRQTEVRGGNIDPSVLIGPIGSMNVEAQNRAVSAARESLTNWLEKNRKLEQAATDLKAKADEAARRVNTTITEISKDITAANQVMADAQASLHGNLTPEQRVDAYNKLFSAAISNAERMRVIDEATFGKLNQLVGVTETVNQVAGLANQIKSLNEGRSNLLNGVKDITGTISSIAGGLSVLGLDPKVADAVNKGAVYAEAAINLVGNIASGNWVGAVLGVAGAFGGGGHSQEQAYHQEIMAGIQQILQNQRIIIKGIEQLLKGQQQILQTLYGMQVQMAQNQRELLARFDELDSKLIKIQATLIELQVSDFDQCSQLQNLGTTDWIELAPALNDNLQKGEAYSSCIKGIDRLINTPLVPPATPTANFALSYFRFENNPALVPTAENRGAARTYLDQISDAFSYFNSVYTTDDDRALALRLLWSRPLGPTVAQSSTHDGLSVKNGDLFNAFPTKINYAAVTKAVDYVLAAHRFVDLDRGEGTTPRFPLQLSTLSSGRKYDGVDAYGFSYHLNLAAIQKLDKLTDLALAQQALLSGISLFPKIASGLTSGEPSTIALLKNHPIIAANYVHWQLRNSVVRPTPAANVAYKFAYQSNDESYMRGFSPNLTFVLASETKAEKCASTNDYVPIPKGWSAKLDACLYVSLPTVYEFNADVFRFTAGFFDMNNAKIRLRDALTQYLFGQTANDHPVINDEVYRYAAQRIVM